LQFGFVAQSFAPALRLQRKLKKGAKFCGFRLYLPSRLPRREGSRLAAFSNGVKKLLWRLLLYAELRVFCEVLRFLLIRQNRRRSPSILLRRQISVVHSRKKNGRQAPPVFAFLVFRTGKSAPVPSRADFT
jgi:hypothetical protein